MVTRIVSGKDIKGALYYNEKKVAAGKAQCIQASGFLKAPADLNFHSKLQRFTDLNRKNIRAKTNTMHISINFHKSESLSTDVLNSIASSYMDKIGFGDQPFLVYEHFDAAHQHLHIVTTLIQENGKRIPINKIGMNESEKARKEIEIDFQLVKAQEQGIQKEEVTITPASVSKAVYGKSETKKSISDIVRYVTQTYLFTSIPELNALLKKYNVIADPGKEGTTMFKKKGLVYSIIDEQGKRIGVPIKASRLSFKPTLAHLEKRFEENEKLRVPFRAAISRKVFDALNEKPASIAALQGILKEANVEVVTRIATDGRIFGITFIDHNTHTIFKGSQLSKELSAKNIVSQLAVNREQQPEDKSPLVVSPSPWTWRRIHTPVVREKRALDVPKPHDQQQRPADTQPVANSQKLIRRHDPAQFQLRFDEHQEHSHYVSRAEYLWTGVTMTYGAGNHSSEDPLGLNRKKKKRRKKRSR